MLTRLRSILARPLIITRLFTTTSVLHLALVLGLSCTWAASAGSVVVLDSWQASARAISANTIYSAPPVTISLSEAQLTGFRSGSASVDAQKVEDAEGGLVSITGTAVTQGDCGGYLVPGSVRYSCGPGTGVAGLSASFTVTDEPVQVTLSWNYSGTPAGSCLPANCVSASTVQIRGASNGLTPLYETSSDGSASIENVKVMIPPGVWYFAVSLNSGGSFNFLDSNGGASGSGSVSFDIKFSAPAEPVIFIPGVAGTVLVDHNASDETLWVGTNPYRWLQLSLYPSANPLLYDVRAREPLRSVATQLIYGPFLDRFANEGFVAYEFLDGLGNVIPERLTEAGCDMGQDDPDLKPDFFPFPYDWRLSNGVNAVRLRDYIGCVQRFHPDSKVNIVSHSMGSLLARRYTLDYASDHGVHKLITIGGPYLGAPKLIYVLETGDFLGLIAGAFNGIFKQIIGSFSGPHELLPSKAYFDLAAALGEVDVVDELDRDLNGDGVLESLDYDQVISMVNAEYGQEGYAPGTTGDAFHQGGQDDWSSDTTGIEFHHILGRASHANSIGGVRASWETDCTAFGFGCTTVPTLIPQLVYGDGTVPGISALRAGNGLDYNAPGALIRMFTSASPSSDKSVEHNGLMSNVDVQDQVLAWLSGSAPPLSGQAVPALVDESPVGLRYQFVTLSGVSSLIVSDHLGNDTALEAGIIDGQIPGVSMYILGDGVWLVALPEASSGDYTVQFETTDRPIGIEILTSDGEKNERALRYLDLVLPAGVPARLVFAPEGIQPLQADSDRDGSFATTRQPSIDVVGAAAEDVLGPEILVTPRGTVPANGMTRVSLAASDPGAGVTDLYYSFTGVDYQPYATELEIDPNVNPVVHVLAQDAVGNRSTRVVPVPEPAAASACLAALATLTWLDRRRCPRRARSCAADTWNDAPAGQRRPRMPARRPHTSSPRVRGEARFPRSA